MQMTQDLNSFGEIIAHAQCSVDEKIYKHVYIRVYHIRIIATTKNWLTQHETDRFLNNHCQECVRAYLSIHDCLSFLHDRQSSDQNFSSRGYHRQSSEQNNRKLISLHNNGEDDKHAHRFADF